MINIIPSIASADQLQIREQMDRIEAVNGLHIDIEDGNFVPNITFGIKTVKAIANYAKCNLDAHLMVMRPDLYIHDLLSCGIRKIAFHVESSMYPGLCLALIRNSTASAGLALNCITSIEAVLPYVDFIDYVLIMTSEPDGQGEKFNRHMLSKIQRARCILPDRVSIMVDGGINTDTLYDVVSSGADSVVLGRSLWNAENPRVQYNNLLHAVNGKSNEN